MVVLRTRATFMNTVFIAPSGIADAVIAAGTQSILASQLGVTQQVVSKWLRRGWVPLRRASEIEARFKIARARLVNPKIMMLLSDATDSR
ncbi:YdaS family helix-turn-helix protein [Massilia frigida]